MVNCYKSVFVAALLVMGSSTAYGDDEFQRATLAGLDGVMVVVSPLDAGLLEDGLRASALQEAIETQLRSAGIPLLSPEAHRETPGLPVLNLVVQVYRNVEVGVYAFSVSLQLNQLVTLGRDPSVTLLAPTWTSSTAMGLLGRAMLGALRDRTADAAQQFVRAHETANRR